MMNIISMSLSASITILAVLVIRWLFIHRLPKKTFMLLWAIVIFQLLIPVSIPSRLSIWNLVDALVSSPSSLADAEVLSSVLIIDNMSSPESVAEIDGAVIPEIPFYTYRSNTSSSPAGLSIFFWFWLTGFVICVLFFILPHLRCRKMYKTALPVENGFVRRWLGSHPQRYSLSIKQSDKVDTPLAFGILWPVILLPLLTDWQDERRLFHVLNHEHEHIRRFDIVWKWVLALSLSLHWFNPLAWLMYILANRDIELSCDEAVVRYYGENSKSEYAMTLLGLEEQRSPCMSLCTNFSKNAVEERIISIMRIKKVSLISILAAFIVICGTGMVFATGRAEPQASNVIWPINDHQWTNTPDFVERMLFVIKGDSRVKVTYDGVTWESFHVNLENEAWRWYSYEEYAQHIELIISQGIKDSHTRDMESNYIIASTYGAERNYVKLRQTLSDIKNGIRVSRPKLIIIRDESGLTGSTIGWMHWYCYSYAFLDRAGNEVNLGLFETRDELFTALRQYYDNEITAGRLTRMQANRLFKRIAHPVRNVDEVPLSVKLQTTGFFNFHNYLF